jgi:hypothetical protein
MGPSGLGSGVGGDLGLRGDLLSRTSRGPGVSICTSIFMRNCMDWRRLRENGDDD